MGTELPPGANLAAIRLEHQLTQYQLARAARVSPSLLSKIEVGDRTLTPATAKQVARALGVTTEEVMGASPVSSGHTHDLASLEAAMRDYDIPDRGQVDAVEVAARIIKANDLRGEVKVDDLLKTLPNLLRQTTTFAVRANSVVAWEALADVYSIVYWVAARHRWRLLAELAVARQQWAVSQHASPVSVAVAQRDRAGTYLNFGSVEQGLAVVDRAIGEAQSSLSGQERAFAVGILNLRGMTLAGRLDDKKEAKREVSRHMKSVETMAEEFGDDQTIHGLSHGPKNNATHILATHVDMGRPKDALKVADRADDFLVGLPPTRVAPTHINTARAKLDVGDRDGALDSLTEAWTVAPEMAKIHPMGREVFRVAASLHRRSNPKLMRLSELSGIDV